MDTQVENNFYSFLHEYLHNWKHLNSDYMRSVISEDLIAREIQQGKAEDYGYEDSVEGWSHSFEYFKDQEMEWVLIPQSIIPLKPNERMAIIRATLTMNGKLVETSNLFFQTFALDPESHEWKLERTYVETGISNT
ncbi:flavoprotein [Halobacillus halophilus]|uniref:flavoprotein n=1 Tax=Halobacillus halophilus TaxID=1570 RepID=UPI001CD80C9D|nr:flavoprotein [Halobacillus halophilus]MCA1009564.1 flavoprotein [Halobacillus halophilus]